MMRFVFAVLLAASAVFAAAPAEFTGGDQTVAGVVSTLSSTAAYDTIGGTDSIVILPGINKIGMTGLVYVRDDLTGGGTDSLKIQIVADALNESGTFLYRTIIDTITAAAGEAVNIPNSIIGDRVRVKGIGLTGTGGQVIFNRGYIYGVRRLAYDK